MSSHYRQNGLETIEVIRGSMSHEAFKGFLVGNIIKYLSRYPHKGGLLDLDKADQYMHWLIAEERKDSVDS